MPGPKFKVAGSSFTSPLDHKVRKEIKIKAGSARITEIFFVNGDEAKEASSVKQFVNLSRSKNFVDGAVVPNLDRTGNKPRLKVRFDKPGAHHFTVKCVPLAGNARYTPTELARNTRFLYQKEQKSYTTGPDGSLILPLDDFFVGAAGKDKYVFHATDDDGLTVSTGNLEVHRLIYYVELKMHSLTSCARSLSKVEHEYAKYNIKLMKLPAVAMEYMPNIDANDDGTFMIKARKAYLKSDAVGKQPYALAIAYTGHLAVKKPNQRLVGTSVQVGPGSPPVMIVVALQKKGSILPELHYLWQGIVPHESWFVSARFTMQGEKPANSIGIPALMCTAVPVSSASPLRSSVVRIDVSGLPKGTGTIELFVDMVERMRGGISFPSTNLLCVCTKAWWSTIGNDVQNQTIVHELGHSIGMVADGSKKLPDRTATWYDTNKGHQGNHCFYGIVADQARYDSSVDLARSKCVMYGAANGISAFCVNCAPAVCKSDLSDGWGPF